MGTKRRSRNTRKKRQINKNNQSKKLQTNNVIEKKELTIVDSSQKNEETNTTQTQPIQPIQPIKKNKINKITEKKKEKKEVNKPIIILKITCKIILIIMLLFTLIGCCVLLKYFPIYEQYDKEAKEIVESTTSDTFKLNEATNIYDKDGNVLASLKGSENTIYLEYNEIPTNVINAFIAVEDQSFWINKGYDLKALLRIGLLYLKNGEFSQGGSTITQQLVKNTLLTPEKTITRKSKEFLMSQYITQKYTKEEIIEFYINYIYYASGYYGIEAASQGYFGCSVSELSLSQIAFLCAIPNSPTYYNPIENINNTIVRRNKILNDMFEEQYISEKDYNTAINEKISIVQDREDELVKQTKVYNYETTYAIDCAAKILMEKEGFEFKYHFDTTKEFKEYQSAYKELYNKSKKELYGSGYEIKTSIDAEKQTILQDAIDNQLSFDDKTDENGVYLLQGAATVIDNKTGNVVAIVGGRSNTTDVKYTLNRAFQSYRQPGSTLKPLVVYTPALQKDYGANSILYNISINEANKKGTKIDELKGSAFTLRAAVEQSKNGCAYQLMYNIHPSYGIEFIENMKFTQIVQSDDYNLSTALGGITYGVTSVEMASAYVTIANYGTYNDVTCITSMKNEKDEELYESYTEEIYESESSKLMLNILDGVITKGTAKTMNWDLETQAVGKTGTTNDCKDGWFCGSTPYYTTSVWVGYDVPKTLNSLCGGTYPAFIWKDTMELYVKDLEPKIFEKPKNLNADSIYLPGRSDDEILSGSYTVADYRSDYAIVDEVGRIAQQMRAIDVNSATYTSDLQLLYTQGLQTIGSIYGINATAKAQFNLDSTYNELLNNYNITHPIPLV